MAQKYAREGQQDKAALELERARDVSPEDVEVLSQLGAYYLENDLRSDAYRVFTQLVTVDPDNIDAQLTLGGLYLEAGATPRAIARAEGVLASDPSRAGAHLLLARAHLRDGNNVRALAELDRIVALEPDNLTNRLIRATGLLSVGRLADARSVVDEVLSRDSSSLSGLLMLAQVAELQEDARAVEHAFVTLGKAHPGNSGYWFTYGSYLLARARKEEARSAFRRAGEIDRRGTKGWERVAELSLEKCDSLTAGGAVAAILARNPGSAAGAYYQGQLLLGEAQFGKASLRFQTVLDLYPNRAEALYFLGMSDYGQRNLRLARGEIERAVEQQPDFREAVILLALVHVDSGEFQAAADLTKELVTGPRVHPEALLVRGAAQLALGETAEAGKTLDRLLGVAPGHARASKLRPLCRTAETRNTARGAGEGIDVEKIQDILSGDLSDIYPRFHGQEGCSGAEIAGWKGTYGIERRTQTPPEQHSILAVYLDSKIERRGDKSALWDVLSDIASAGFGPALPATAESEFVAVVSGDRFRELPLPHPAAEHAEPGAAEIAQTSADQPRVEGPAFPEALEVAEAKTRTDPSDQEEWQRAWAEAQQAGSVRAVEAFLKEHPDAPQVNEAQQLVAKLHAEQRENQERRRADQAWARAEKIHTSAAYQEFRKRHPKHPRFEEAGRRAKDQETATAAFRAAKKAGSARSMQAFLKNHPEASQAPEARRILKKLNDEQRRSQERKRADKAWAETEKAGTAAAYREFCDGFPQHPRAKDAVQRAERLDATAAFRAMKKTPSIRAVEAFIAQYPTAPQAAEALDMLQRLRAAQWQETARAHAEQAWQEAENAHTVEAYGGFRERYPEHPMAEEARRRIAILGAEGRVATAPPTPFNGATQDHRAGNSPISEGTLGGTSSDVGERQAKEDRTRPQLVRSQAEGIGSDPDDDRDTGASDLPRDLSRQKRSAIEKYRRELQGE